MTDEQVIANYLRRVYRKLYTHFGPQHWWPAENAFEVILGTILTQNTAWSNVEKAIQRLKRKKLIDPERLYRCRMKTVAELIRPAGYYNIKAARIKNFLDFLFAELAGNLTALFSLRTNYLREKLLQIKGIGPETADSILLYAAGKPIFVVDAYTKRFLWRHKLINKDASYQEIQSLFQRNLPVRRYLFNEYHALIVCLGKHFCRRKALCKLCPLKQEKKLFKRKK